MMASAISSEDHLVLQALLLPGGADPDETLRIQRDSGRGSLVTQETNLLAFAVERATVEAKRITAEEWPTTSTASRADRLIARAWTLSTSGPAHSILAMLLRAGCPKSLRSLIPSAVTGVTRHILTQPCQEGITHVVSALLAAGADPNLGMTLATTGWSPEHSYELPLESAVGWGHFGIVVALLGAGAVVTPRALASAGERGDAGAARAMLSTPSGVSALNQRCTHPSAYEGFTPLQVACMYGAAHVAREMLAGGADAVGAGAWHGRGDPDSPVLRETPMGCALASGALPELIEMLVGAGARRPRIEGVEYVSPDGSRTDLHELRHMAMFLTRSFSSKEMLRDVLGCDGCGSCPPCARRASLSAAAASR